MAYYMDLAIPVVTLSINRQERYCFYSCQMCSFLQMQ